MGGINLMSLKLAIQGHFGLDIKLDDFHLSLIAFLASLSAFQSDRGNPFCDSIKVPLDLQKKQFQITKKSILG